MLKLAGQIKTLVVCGSVVTAIWWFASASRSPVAASVDPVARTPFFVDVGYVGSDACKDCHEDQFKAFSHTSHSQLSTVGSWKGK